MLHAAHNELQKLVTREGSGPRSRGRSAWRYADLVYDGLWFTPLREALDAFVEKVQERVTGVVRLKLFKGDCRVVGRQSPFALYERALATYDAGDTFDHSAADGFVKIFGLPVETSPRRKAPAVADRRAADCSRRTDDDALVRTIRRGARCGRVRVRRVVPLRSPPVRRRRDRQPRVGAGAGAAPACSPPTRRAQIDDGARRRSSSAAARDPAFVDGPDEDVHSFVERLLVERLGDAGRRLHTGRSRNEQVSLDLRLYLRRRIPLLQRAVAGVVDALAAQADAAGDALMPSFTHLRPAQPVLVAHFFLAHVAALRRDFARLAAARGEADALPLGSGAIAGTSYADRRRRARPRLGFSRVVANSIDASSDRDFAATFLYACALTMVHLSRLAEDLDHLLRRRAPLLRAVRRARAPAAA